jgi:hypothetical protein
MTVSNLCFAASGLVMTVPSPKADQEQTGDKVAIPFTEHEDHSPAQLCPSRQRYRGRSLSRSRSSRPRSELRPASRFNRGDFPDRHCPCRA